MRAECSSFTILESVCANTPEGRRFLILQARDEQSGDIVWAVGDDQTCAVSSADFVRDCTVNYEDVCIQEFSYQESCPESVGSWRPLIQELVRYTLRKYLDLDGEAHVYPQWLPEDIEFSSGRKHMQTAKRGARYITLRNNGVMEFVY